MALEKDINQNCVIRLTIFYAF